MVPTRRRFRRRSTGRRSTGLSMNRDPGSALVALPLGILAIPALVALIELRAPVLGALPAGIRPDAVVPLRAHLVVGLRSPVFETPPPVHAPPPDLDPLVRLLPRPNVPEREPAEPAVRDPRADLAAVGSAGSAGSGTSSYGVSSSGASRRGRASSWARRNSNPAPGRAPKRPWTSSTIRYRRSSVSRSRRTSRSVSGSRTRPGIDS